MDNKNNFECSLCSIDYVFRKIGGKYKARVLWYLYLGKIFRYGELRRMLTPITPKMLTQVLRELEQDNLIIRTEYPQIPPKVEYRLSELGKELIPTLSFLKEWGDEQRKKEIEVI